MRFLSNALPKTGDESESCRAYAVVKACINVLYTIDERYTDLRSYR
jgi:hypothetical protein